MQIPSAFVDDVVVATTQREQVVEIGVTAQVPFVDVVDLAAVELDVAAVEGARAVHRPQGTSLALVRQALLPPDVDGNAVGVRDDRNDRSVADQTHDRGRRDLCTVVELAHRMAVQLSGRGGLLVDVDTDLGLDGPTGLVAAGDQVAECFGGDV